MKTVRRALIAAWPFLAGVTLALLFVACVVSIGATFAQRVYINSVVEYQECVRLRDRAMTLATAEGALALADVIEGKQGRSFRPQMEVAIMGLERIDEECPPVVRPR